MSNKVTVDTKKFKTFLLDFDGTISDSEPLHYESASRTLSHYGKSYVSFEEHQKIYTGTGTHNVFSKEKEKHQLDANISDLQELFNKNLEKLISEKGIPLMKGINEFLKKAKQKGIKLAIVSGSKREIIDWSLKDSGLDIEFDLIITKEDYENPKPDPECFLTAAQKLGSNKSECLVFEDAFNGIKAAKNAKIEVIGIGIYLDRDRVKAEFADTNKFADDFTQIVLN